MKRFIIAAMFAATLSGCAWNNVVSRQTVFHNFNRPVAGTTYVIIPFQDQASSLESQTYLFALKSELNALGMKEATIATADIAVAMDYGVDDGTQVVESTPIFLPSGGTSFTSGTVNSSNGQSATYSGTTTQQGGIAYAGNMTSTHTKYLHRVLLTMADGEMGRQDKLQKIYEARAYAYDKTKGAPNTYKAMIHGLFQNFPGNNGSSREVSVIIDESTGKFVENKKP